MFQHNRNPNGDFWGNMFMFEFSGLRAGALLLQFGKQMRFLNYDRTISKKSKNYTKEFVQLQICTISKEHDVRNINLYSSAWEQKYSSWMINSSAWEYKYSLALLYPFILCIITGVFLFVYCAIIITDRRCLVLWGNVVCHAGWCIPI